ncbi:carboxylesterase family protein [Microbacterium resistens]|uniref:carboxylesterase/lipase family protein n=1 Tax=Microbacterium resistens TaxID=156977 RepID=UPI001C5727CE|nr:carboxylesterase family protein [Microbacterium resistens]MBW1639360.1 carboxylesterase family protein [Microbacterium resistens]
MTDSDTPAGTGAAPVVTTSAGPVRGMWRGTPGTPAGSAAFLGIPFAAPPTGRRRFLAPVPPEPWTEVRDATAYGPTAQRGDKGETLIPEPSIPGASTLNVNVFTPHLPEWSVSAGSDGRNPQKLTTRQGAGDATGLPVMVWIHGGGYTDGSPASPWYDGRTFTRDGVVSVSISYRLGFDGFGIIDGAPANRGVLDWIAALEWVRENIAAFGGDPSRVTIAGQSAGGGAVLRLLALEQAQHLFHAALAISPALADLPRERVEARSHRLAELAGCDPDLDGFRSVPERRIMKLQPQAALLGRTGIAAVTATLTDGLPWGPVIDGELVTISTVDALRAGVGADKPLLLGATDDEFTMVLDDVRGRLRLIPAAWLVARFLRDRPVRRAWLAANRPQRRKGTAAVLGRFVTDSVFRSLVVRAAEARGAAPTWAYRFAWVSPTKGWSCHCLDVPFWFDCLDDPHVARLAGDDPPQQLATDMHGAAVAFVRTGDPGWAPWRRAPGTARVFGAPPGEPLVSTTAYDDALPLA